MFQHIVDTQAMGVIVLDHELRVLYLNPAAEALLQVSLSQATNAPIQELVLLTEKIQAQLVAALTSNQPFTERDTTLRLPDNISQQVDFTVNIIESNGNLLLELYPLNRFQRINRDDESVARQETTRHLVRGLAHEVKNPLGGIRGAAQLLEKELSDEEQREYTNVIISEADRLTELVDRMLGPQKNLQIAPVNLLKVIEHVIQLVEAERPDFVQWRRDYDPSLPDLEADEPQLIQAVMNVVRNACEAMHDTEEPRIQLRSRGIRQFTIGQTLHRLVMQLDITDNGPGIEAAMAERIFFPMISGRPDGTGLGLAITQNIIDQHGGSIQVSSKPGQTCFTIYLPFTQEAASSEADPNPKEATALKATT